MTPRRPPRLPAPPPSRRERRGRGPIPVATRVATDKGAQLIVYQSATSTFQDTWAPEQHASLSALRAAETGRPVAQAALTGVSVAFDARGRELAWLGTSQHGAVVVKLALPPGPQVGLRAEYRGAAPKEVRCYAGSGGCVIIFDSVNP